MKARAIALRSLRFRPILVAGAIGTCSSMRTTSRMLTNCLSLQVSGSSRHSSRRGTRVEQIALHISATLFMLALLCRFDPPRPTSTRGANSHCSQTFEITSKDINTFAKSDACESALLRWRLSWRCAEQAPLSCPLHFGSLLRRQMNETEPTNLLYPRLANNSIRVQRKHFQERTGVEMPAIPTLEVRYPGLRIVQAQRTQQMARKVDHKQREVHGVGDGSLLDPHEVLQPKVPLGVPERKLDLEPQRVIVDQGCCAQEQVGAEEDHVPLAPAPQVPPVEDDHVQQAGELLVPTKRLIDAG